MTAAPIPLFSARTDDRDWLVEAGAPLTALQIYAGGGVPGAIHIPAILEIVRQVRLSNLAITKSVVAHSSSGTVRACFGVRPNLLGAGTLIDVFTWQSQNLESDSDKNASETAIHQLAEMVLTLDAEDRIVSVQGTGYDTAQPVSNLTAHQGKLWQECIGTGSVEAVLMEEGKGALYSFTGSSRVWSAHELKSPINNRKLLAFVAVPVPAAEHPDASDTDGDAGALGEELRSVLSLPIARITANAQTICAQLAGPLASHYSRYAQDIADSSEYMQLMLEDVSEIDAVSTEDFKILLQGIDLVQVARKSAEMLRAPAHNKNITLTLPLTDSGVMAVGDARRAQQIAINLLNNAIKYSPQGSEIRLHVWSDETSAYLSVTDQGAGVEASQIPKMFNKFERLSRSGDGGSGLGLFISRRLAQAMNGDIAVESAIGQGSIFTLHLAKDRRSS